MLVNYLFWLTARRTRECGGWTPLCTVAKPLPFRICPVSKRQFVPPQAKAASSRRTPYVLGCIAAVLLLASGCERATAPMLAYNESSAIELRKLLQAGQKAAAAAGAASAAEPTGWATLQGKFTLNGSAPSRAPLNADKDLQVCAPGGQQPLSETVVIGPGNGIKNVVIYLSTPVPADNPNWEHPSYAETKSGEVLFDQKNCVFLSHVGAMRATQKMKVLNSDPVGHNTNLASTRGAAQANILVAANGSQSYVPGKSSPAPFSVGCNIHPWMTAWLMVCDTPYFAVTNEEGSFEIPNLPAGVPLEFRVWQEKVAFLQAVSVDGQATKWNKGKFPLTLNAGEAKDLNVVVDAAVFQ